MNYQLLTRLLLLALGTFAIVDAACPRPSSPKDGFFDEEPEKGKSEFSPGTVFSFFCRIGYKIEKDRSIFCKGDSWTPMPECVLVEHAASWPPIVIRTTPAPTTTKSTTTAKPTPRPPKPGKCGRPPTVENSRTRTFEDEYAPSSLVYYNCKTGYMMVGASYVKCGSDGQWSNPPTCKETVCNKPSLNNVIINPNRQTYKYSDTIKFKCPEGSKYEGPPVAICFSSGRWSYSESNTPRCSGGSSSGSSTCSMPKSPADANLLNAKSKYNMGEVAEFRCNGGFIATGSAKVTCRGNDEWSTSQLTCTRPVRECRRPTIPSNGNVEGKDFKVNSVIKFSCAVGYRLTGSDKLFCREGGEWSGKEPTCKVIECSSPPTISNTMAFTPKESYVFSDHVTYRCIDGYRMDGEARIVCNEKGSWTNAPRCMEIIITCPTPPVVDNTYAIIQRVKYRYKDQISYLCRLGFAINGERRITCNENGQWDKPPLCQVVECDSPKIENGFIKSGRRSTYIYEDEVEFGCDGGYDLVGETATCNRFGNWNNLPSCEEQKTKCLKEENQIQYSATSSYCDSRFCHRPNDARNINSGIGWMPELADEDHYLELDFGKSTDIAFLYVKGGTTWAFTLIDTLDDVYVKSFFIELQTEKHGPFRKYRENGKVVEFKTFRGDRQINIEFHRGELKAHKIRIVPTSYQLWIMIKVEVIVFC